MAEDSGWCTIESDPGVFTELLHSIGVKNIQVEEIYSLDRDDLNRFGQVYGVVFLFKYRSNEQESAKSRSGQIVSVPDGLFFANQTIRNACATQAILSIVLNSPVDIGDELRQFEQFSAGMDPTTKGMVLSNSETIRVAHNSFAVQQTLFVDDSTGEKEDPFHFVAYVPWKGHVYELDGLQQGPRKLGAFDNDNWLDLVTPEVTSRISEYEGAEIRFNLMVVVDDQRQRIKAQIEELRQQQGDNSLQLSQLESDLLDQEGTRKRWAIENGRRRWNFMPMIVEFLKLLAETGHAGELIEKTTALKKEAFRRAAEARKGESSTDK